MPMSLTVLALLWIVCPACLAAMHPSQDIVVAPDNVLQEASSLASEDQALPPSPKNLSAVLGF